MHILQPLLLMGATASFALGVTLPLVRIDRFYFLTETPSLIGILRGLWTGGDGFLALVVGLFSLVLPTLKLGLLHLGAYSGDPMATRPPHWLKWIANWSMLDVVLVALVIFAARTSGLATASSQPGMWFFTLSVILTALATAIAARRS